MTAMKRLVLLPMLAWVAGPGASLAGAATTNERLYQYCEVTSQHAQDNMLTNLGPTGAKGWIYLNRFYIDMTEPGSPAEGLLKKGDYVLGVNGKKFPDVDPRVMLGNEINQSESSNGKLALLVGNQGKERTVTVLLKPIGGRAPTWPFDCKKSTLIRTQALSWLREHQGQDGSLGSSVFTSLNALFLLASPAPADQEAARRCVYQRVDGDPSGEGYNAWGYGYSALLMAEYYLATGDSAVLPRLTFYAKELAAGQTKSGSWCHGMSVGGVPGGYAELNIMGVVCFLSLALIDDCGVPVDQVALAKATHFFGRYAGLGTIPYGDDPPWTQSPSSANKDAVAAIAFRVLGDREKTRAFAEDTCLSYQLTEDAHTGAFFSATWGPLGAILAPDRSGLRRLLNEQSWYYDLERRWDGSIAYLPNPENLTGATQFDGEPLIVTGGLSLAYALPWKSLCILGAEAGPFSKKTSSDLAPAITLFKEKRWDAFDALTKSWAKTASGPGTSPQAKNLLAKRTALQTQVEWTLATVEKAAAQPGLRRTERERARAMLTAAMRLAGKDHDQAQALRARLDAVKELPEPAAARETKKPVVARSWKPLLPLAKDLANGAPAKRWRVHAWTGDISPYLDNLEPAGAAMKGWYLPDFNAAKWQEKTAPFRAHDHHSDTPFEGQPVSPVSHHLCMFQPRPLYNTYARLGFEVTDAASITAARIVQQNCHQYLRSEVYLNGFRVAAILRPNTCELTPEATKLLRQGKNVIALYLTSCRGHLHDFDFGIEVSRK